MEQTLSEKSNSIQFLFIFHVSIYFHHSVNFHFRNKQLFIVHRKDNGRYNDPLFSPSTVQFFFLRTHYYLRLLSGYPSNTTARACDPSLVNHSISLSPNTLIELGKDERVPTGEVK